MGELAQKVSKCGCKLLSKLMGNPSSRAKKIGCALKSAINFYLARGDFCRLPITFANGLDPYQDRQNVGPDLEPYRLTP